MLLSSLTSVFLHPFASEDCVQFSSKTLVHSHSFYFIDLLCTRELLKWHNIGTVKLQHVQCGFKLHEDCRLVMFIQASITMRYFYLNGDRFIQCKTEVLFCKAMICLCINPHRKIKRLFQFNNVNVHKSMLCLALYRTLPRCRIYTQGPRYEGSVVGRKNLTAS